VGLGLVLVLKPRVFVIKKRSLVHLGQTESKEVSLSPLSSQETELSRD